MADPDNLLKYLDVSRSALSGEVHTNKKRPHDISVSAEITKEDKPAIRLKVHGGPQHAIAGTNFAKLP